MMLDAYLRFALEHQAELELDAVNHRLVAQFRLAAPRRVARSSAVSRVAGFLGRFSSQLGVLRATKCKVAG
jgi:hypothetical protein